MKHPKIFFAVCVFLIGTGLSLSQNQPAATANYELAERFSPDRLKAMVFSTSVDANWLKESDRFWYSFETSDGKLYNIVDPVRKTKNVLFDHDEMAAKLTLITKDPYDAQNLPIERIRFIDRDRAIQFEVKSSQWEKEDETEEIKEDQEEKQEQVEKKASGDTKKEKKIFHFKYHLETGELEELKDFKKPESRPRWANISPDSSIILFARNYNLYWMDRENYEKALKDDKDTTIVEHQITDDGEEHYSYCVGSRGETDIKREKNKDDRRGVSGAWSHDSEKFAMTRTDSREVKDLWVLHYTANPRPELETYKYQMPGEKESPQIELLLFEMETKEKLEIKADAFKDQTLSILTAPRLQKERNDDYVPAKWLSLSSDKLYFSRTSRDLKRIDICLADAETGEVKTLIEERLNTYVETRPLGLVNDGKELIHWSERDGWAHFYLFDENGKLKNQITSGPFHANRIEGIDERRRILYFTANGREPGEDPYYRHLYKINFDGSGLKLLNEGNYDHRISLSDSRRFFVNNYSRVNTVPKAVLMDINGKEVMDLERADLSLLFEAGYQFPEPFTVKAGDGITDLYGVMYKPFDFDSTRQYPLIQYVYPGPQTEAVDKYFSTSMDRTDRLAQFGFIVVTVGNRGGHPARSKWYHNYGYGNLRDYGLEDKKVSAERLAARHPWIDIDRVGIFGHSGGGFMSTAAMLVYPDFFKVAVSSAGNHENQIYNRWWSEKHHGVEEIKDKDGNITFKYEIDTNSELAQNLKGRLLICTGDVDNNVHPAGTIRMAEALIKANKRFDFFVFPSQRHGFGNMSQYFFWLKADYFCRHLLGDWQDSVDMIQLNREKPNTGSGRARR
jgi:dipeptidyl-peptidase 4